MTDRPERTDLLRTPASGKDARFGTPDEQEFYRRFLRDNKALGPVLYHKLVTVFGQPRWKPDKDQKSFTWVSDDFECLPGDDEHMRGWFIGMYRDMGMMFLGTGSLDEEPLTDQRVLDLIEWCRTVGVQVYYKKEWITEPKQTAGQISARWHRRYMRR